MKDCRKARLQEGIDAINREQHTASQLNTQCLEMSLATLRGFEFYKIVFPSSSHLRGVEDSVQKTVPICTAYVDPIMARPGHQE
jgi:hypothetical protein